VKGGVGVNGADVSCSAENVYRPGACLKQSQFTRRVKLYSENNAIIVRRRTSWCMGHGVVNTRDVCCADEKTFRTRRRFVVVAPLPSTRRVFDIGSRPKSTVCVCVSSVFSERKSRTRLKEKSGPRSDPRESPRRYYKSSVRRRWSSLSLLNPRTGVRDFYTGAGGKTISPAFERVLPRNVSRPAAKNRRMGGGIPLLITTGRQPRGAALCPKNRVRVFTLNASR